MTESSDGRNGPTSDFSFAKLSAQVKLTMGMVDLQEWTANQNKRIQNSGKKYPVLNCYISDLNPKNLTISAHRAERDLAFEAKYQVNYLEKEGVFEFSPVSSFPSEIGAAPEIKGDINSCFADTKKHFGKLFNTLEKSMEKLTFKSQSKPNKGPDKSGL